MRKFGVGHAGDVKVEKPVLLLDQKASDSHLRIWRYDDGRYLFERMRPTGKGIAVFCPTFDEAVNLLCQPEADRTAEVPEVETTKRG